LPRKRTKIHRRERRERRDQEIRAQDNRFYCHKGKIAQGHKSTRHKGIISDGTVQKHCGNYGIFHQKVVFCLNGLHCGEESGKIEADNCSDDMHHA